MPCMSNDCIHCLGVWHEGFTWVDLWTLLVDKKPKLACLLEHIVLRLSQARMKRGDCTAVCSGMEAEEAGERFLHRGWRCCCALLHLTVFCILSPRFNYLVLLDVHSVPCKQSHVRFNSTLFHSTYLLCVCGRTLLFERMT